HARGVFHVLPHGRLVAPGFRSLQNECRAEKGPQPLAAQQVRTYSPADAAGTPVRSRDAEFPRPDSRIEMCSVKPAYDGRVGDLRTRARASPAGHTSGRAPAAPPPTTR